MNRILEIIVFLMITITVLGCSSSELVENWKNPEIESFEASKLLIIGITPKDNVQKDFEKKLAYALKKNGVSVIQSVDYFKENFTAHPKTEEELLALENSLMEDGFDAILISKVLGEEDKVSLIQAYRNIDRTFSSFREDYYESQDIYQNKATYEEYKVYHAQSSLYCICPDKDRELIWKAAIDVTEPDHIRKGINDYVKLLIWALTEQRLLIIKNVSDESVDI